MATTPRVADCHVTASSSSATETLKPWRIWSLSERTTCRRSLSDRACSMRISSVKWATGMALKELHRQCKPEYHRCKLKKLEGAGGFSPLIQTHALSPHAVPGGHTDRKSTRLNSSHL